MKIGKFLACSAVLTFTGCLVGQVDAALLWVHDTNEKLATVDTVSGDIVIKGTMSAQITDIAFDTDGKLYAIDSQKFYEVNPETADLTLIGSHGITGAVALSADDQGRMYAASDEQCGLFEIDETTGSGVKVLDVPLCADGDLSWLDDRMYWSTTDNYLARTHLDLGYRYMGYMQPSNVWGLATGQDDELYGFAGKCVYRFDTEDGDYEFVMNLNSSELCGIGGATAAPIPEPATAMFGVAGLVGVMVMRNRKRA
ncbi:hypothetical protein JD969_16075 [Planctomycetota bacterium]|nr:hypothetical protein JD969_16075 [Planctomycetota bacterium]